MNTPRGGEYAARIRAAHAYAGLKQPELAKLLGLSVETVSRLENGRGNANDERILRRVAEACGVPYAFMEHGWAALTVSADSDRRAQVMQADPAVVAAIAETAQAMRNGGDVTRIAAGLAQSLLAGVEALRRAEGEAPAAPEQPGRFGRGAEGAGQ